MDEEEVRQKIKDQDKFLQIALENYVKALQAGVGVQVKYAKPGSLFSGNGTGYRLNVSDLCRILAT